MNNQLTSYYVTSAYHQDAEQLRIETGLTKTSFQRKAIDYYLLHGDGKIEDSLKIKERKNPYYVKKSVREQIYLDQSQRFYLQKIADENHVGITIVLFQALITYCVFLSN